MRLEINDIFEERGGKIYIKGKFLFDMWQTYGLPPEAVKKIIDEHIAHKSEPEKK